jgi:hypothetical protein
MERIKDLSKITIQEGSCLVEVVKPKRVILMPDGTDDQDAYMKVLKVGSAVTDVEVGDICLKYSGGIYIYVANEGKTNQKDYAILYRSGMTIIVKPDNFTDSDKVVSKITL